MNQKLKNDLENLLSQKILPIEINHEKIEKIMNKASEKKCWVIAFVVGTKPCFNKIYGSLTQYSKRDMPFFVINANQHYDTELTHMANEFGINQYVAVNLNIRGNLVQKINELNIKTIKLATYLKSKWPKVYTVPVVLGDTIICPTVSLAWMFTTQQKAIHLEAGLRSMSPIHFNHMKPNINFNDFIQQQINGEWQIVRNEPYPEQWNTFVTSASCDYLLAPLTINKKHLINEGYNKKYIFTTGGLVVDAINMAKKMITKKRQIFDLYPQLKYNKWVRIDIHRKENVTTSRFLTIFSAIENLVKSGICVNLVLMNTFKESIKEFKLEKKLAKLKKYKNFLATTVWPSYSDVYDFYTSKNFIAAITDSGGVQEDMNIIGKPCITIRFCTDRPETVKNNTGNILVPPIDSSFLTKMISKILSDTSLLYTMQRNKKIYGHNTGTKVATILEKIATTNKPPFKWSNDVLNES
ncbi:MAG: UDP-N-acetylglucosamine 2-epimerase [Patescibacteria group bacterium]|nr:UDP-N-acetylglucosamine 2-epimerase [Patescibacteria group bacterium]